MRLTEERGDMIGLMEIFLWVNMATASCDGAIDELSTISIQYTVEIVASSGSCCLFVLFVENATKTQTYQWPASSSVGLAHSSSTHARIRFGQESMITSRIQFDVFSISPWVCRPIHHTRTSSFATSNKESTHPRDDTRTCLLSRRTRTHPPTHRNRTRIERLSLVARR